MHLSQADQSLVRENPDERRQGHALVLLRRRRRSRRLPRDPKIAAFLFAPARVKGRCESSGFSRVDTGPGYRFAHPGYEKQGCDMVVRAGREFLAIPGPTNVPDAVLQAMHRPALDIYSTQMVDLTDGLLEDLGKLFVTEGRTYIHIANGHGAWESTLSNVLSRGDKILVLESGRFAIGWGSAAAAMGVEVEVLKGDWRRAIRPAEVEARLRLDADHRIKAILAVQVDTASGVHNDIEAIGKAIRAAGHPALFMVDAVASLGCMPFEMDAWGIDVAMSG